MSFTRISNTKIEKLHFKYFYFKTYLYYFSVYKLSFLEKYIKIINF